jgi:hypothetical protein
MAMYGSLISVCCDDDSSILARSAEALIRCRAIGSFQVQAVDLLELFDDVVDHALVEVFAAQEGVAVGRQHFELLLAIDVSDFDDRHVEGTAAQVIHGDLAVAFFGLVQAEGQRRAVGSLMMRLTSRPAMRPASLVAWRCESLK